MLPAGFSKSLSTTALAELTRETEIAYEPLVLSNEPVEDEFAVRERLFKPIKNGVVSKALARGPKEPELIDL